ncbi:MAG: hypothetical protein IJJ20_02950 [Thermoguttaceae bacterium]|nr:hypothetical protein [Thermoguttaceae bacterium]
MMNARKLRVESLEERVLLAVAAGGVEQAAVLAAPTEAVTRVVNTLEDPAEWDTADNVVSLREAIDAAADGDTITFASELTGGTVTLSGKQLEVDKAITIDASSVGGITIDAGGQSRVFHVGGGNEANPVELIGLTITGGKYGGEGGAIWNYGVLTVTNTAISGNSAGWGGGIYNSSGTLTVIGSTVTGNAANYGGGISNYGILTVTDTAISGNSADWGGGIYNGSDTLTVIGSTVSENTANSYGGGIYNRGTLKLTESAISGNSADWGGGIINYSLLTITSTVVSGNTAGSGGGIYSYSGTMTFTDSVISGNTADYGGGISNLGTVKFTGVTISGNTASSCGGGINNIGTLTLVNTIVSLNYADWDSDIYNYSGPLSGSNNIIGLDPGFVVAPLVENGRLVNADEIDLSLTAGSIAIDAGTNSAVETETDFAGNQRIFAAWRAIPTVDIGAYEFQTQVERGEIETPSIIVTTTLDLVDETDGLISLREAIAYAVAGETITFDTLLTNRIIVLGGAELTIDKDLVIDASAIGGITIDARGENRAFYIGNVSDEISITLIGLVIQNGRAYKGGGIYNDSDSTLMLTDAAVTMNNANDGGGIYISSGMLTVTDSAFSENGAGSSGGGIYSSSGTTTVTGSFFSENGAGSSGGGVYSGSGTTTVTGSVFSENGAVGSGGGIYSGSGTTTVTGSVFSENGAGSSGGGIYSGSGMVMVTDSIITENTANRGGGINNSSGTLLATNTVISGNSANDDNSSGGGIYNDSYGTITVTGSTIAGNSAGNYGGGIYNDSGTLTVTNTIVSLNNAESGNNIYSHANTMLGSNNIIGLDPGFVIAPIFEDGKLINAGELDFSLTPESAAIDRGTNEVVEYETDLAGNPRISAAWRETATVDIGAYEYQERVEQEPMSTIVTTNLDIFDVTDGQVSLREAIFYAAPAETITFDESLAGGTITLNGTQLEIYEGVIIDASAIDGITIDANGSSRVFYVAGGNEMNPVELIALTITGGGADGSQNRTAKFGGGIYNGSGTLMVIGSAITGNYSNGGGGIFSDLGTVTVIDTLISRNFAGSGGGIFSDFGTVTVVNTLVSENTAQSSGGGIYSGSSTVTVTDSIISGNTANQGGGINNSSGTVTVTDSTITENTANQGGGINNRSGTLSATNTVISGNSANGNNSSGGGIYNNATLSVTNSVITGNSANDYNGSGGGFYNNRGALTVTNSTVAENSAKNSKYGGLYTYGGTVRFYNSIIADSIPISSSRLYAYNTLSSFTLWDGSENCLVYDSSKPLFADPSRGDYTLAKNSQAIDVGNNNYVTIKIDLAGNPRIVEGIVDLGAFEYTGLTEPLDSPTITTGSRGVYVSCGANRHRLQWTAVENAFGYELAYSTDGNDWTAISVTETAAVVTGLTYGQDIQYRVRALGTGSYTDSEWSEVKTFNVCPMDVSGDGDIGGLDRNILAVSWGAEEGDEDYCYYADVNGDGDVGGVDRNFLGSNWGAEAGDGDLVYPKSLAAADNVFAEFASADFGADLSIF